ncbi:transcription factor IIA subunit alpha [Yamadazyma tenuis]|uniref:Transcription initiation factor IIA large subunit n=1 Tax=Candida tenuis (strain ATCC 10573 / BCRC 21748 / CBS 615 / JCM 9827 / NBRC 10315 / NRRL Y-1498 / VKM Y-70) TaxID=590646 RepID=G3B5H4_CANTC|nr:uncharacterized protein CANTEDRAFT_123183 [Yamadazyma tenuis ATCC 10573]XP_006687020.1 uncharacterized protein CANTEDRAFT_123183 [Yamadazyma tenuis ATCC 10573]EGV63226.1 hypothetical protein CANTEDRAFT_123183 [Yamadazyma tenuis ATCC 10573]EGV63227.1 hypothetical protein CANTEDRAFT_123183 [Yamadazyma tenuis ATCC 10573]WEJ96954.1 transcription factor IIA subunit alpha [Yamadazyma tenuis]
MSNIEASKLYEAIIEEVINDSRQDFENSGVDENTLQELKKIWQEKLTQSQVSRFTWDDEAHAAAGQQGLQSNRTPSLGNHDIKQELQDDLLISNDYGLGADQQLSYSNEVNLNNTNVNNHDDIGIQIPNIGNSQSFKDEYDDSNGLMLPNVTQTDGASASQSFEMTIYTNNPKKVLSQLQKVNQVDGELGVMYGDEFNDSDDINSDLDDDLDSDRSDDEDNDLDGHIMLCLYDKVQRIKNKWKCSLKEGIASINGRDYVFQKATGESEW